jgi:germacradienol/geosmin synthase
MDTATIISTSERRIRINVQGPWGSLPGSLRLPFRSGINPHVDDVREQNLAWSIEIGLVEEDDDAMIDAIDRCRFDQLAALCHRDCSLEALQLITNCYTAIFVFDDMLDDAKSEIGSSEVLAHHVTAYLSAAVADEARPPLREDVPSRARIIAVGNAYANVARRLLRYTDRAGIRHYVAGMRQYFEGCVMESRKRNKRMAHVADYTIVRLRCSAVYPTLDIGAIVEGFEVMRSATNLCVSYVNDVFSYAKESSAGEFSNLVTVYQSYGMDLRDAMAAAMATNDRVVEEYFEAKAYFQRDNQMDEATRGYVKIMEDWMRGNFDWYHQRRTERYEHCLTAAIPA